jgi:hypothetical protein
VRDPSQALCLNRAHGEEMIRDFSFCNLWKPHLTREEALQWFAPLERRDWHGRPCTSPRRNQCRTGSGNRFQQCEALPW